MKFVAIDPGEAAGFSVWDTKKPHDGPSYGSTLPLWELIDAITDAAGLPEAMQSSPRFRHVLIKTPTDLYEALDGWEMLVVEDWALYPWELANLGWDKCRTARGIGALEALCRLVGKPIVLQPAAIKEPAEAAGAEEFFMRPLHDNRHLNDSCRHGWYYLVRGGFTNHAKLPRA